MSDGVGVVVSLAAGDEMHRNFFGLANLENPSDNVLHLVVGIWAAAAAYLNRRPWRCPRAAPRSFLFPSPRVGRVSESLDA